MIRRLLNYWTQCDDLLAIATDYREVCQEQQDIIARRDAEIMALKLEYARWGKGIVENFLRAQESGTDVADVLVEALRDFDDEIARLEEHCPV